ncbi:MAG: hypothetical protein ACJ749_01840, partial [Flavisolibacter sp.]
IYHYGWVKSPQEMKSKIVIRDRINFDKETDDNVEVHEDYPLIMVNALAKFKGNHPKVMEKRIAEMSWKFEYDLSKNKLPLNDRTKNLLQKITGRRFFDYKNYRIV